MLKTPVLAILFALCCAPAFGQESSKLRYRYDAFKDETSVATPEMSVVSTSGIKISLIASFSYEGQRYQRPDTATLLFVAFADNWLFLEPPTIRAIIVEKSGQSERVLLGTARVVTAKILVGAGVKTREALNLQVATEDLLKLADAEIVLLQLRTGVEFAVKGNDLEQLRSLAAQLRKAEE